MASIEVVLGDITKLEVGAIVNAANERLLGGGGVDGAIHRAAGIELLEECRKIGGCPTGEARITKAYLLPSKHIIHTVGPIWKGGEKGEPEKLRNCYRNSLILAEKNKIKTIAFPSISTGIYRYPIELASKIAIDECKVFLDFSKTTIEKIIFVTHDEHDYEIYKSNLD